MYDYTDEEFIGYVIHPSGRKVKVRDAGTHEPDTNAYTSEDGYPIFEYEDTGEELNWDELNEKHSRTHYLHEWLLENTEWD